MLVDDLRQIFLDGLSGHGRRDLQPYPQLIGQFHCHTDGWTIRRRIYCRMVHFTTQHRTKSDLRQYTFHASVVLYVREGNQIMSKLQTLYDMYIAIRSLPLTSSRAAETRNVLTAMEEEYESDPTEIDLEAQSVISA
jgi:hypothetical protein